MRSHRFPPLFKLGPSRSRYPPRSRGRKIKKRSNNESYPRIRIIPWHLLQLSIFCCELLISSIKFVIIFPFIFFFFFFFNVASSSSGCEIGNRKMLAIGAAEVAAKEMDGGATVAAAETRAHRSHSEAERKRRQRINGHLATLRGLLPSAARMDKATLLGEVVRHVRELKEMADGVAVVVPGEGDEVGVEERGEGKEGRVTVWVCCADRPGLMGELSRAVGSVRARAVRAEMTAVGGRTRSVLEVEMMEVKEGGEEARTAAALQAALRAVLLTKGPGSDGTFKRPRLATRFKAT